MAACNLFGRFRYAGVEAGSQCFCGNELPAKQADPKAKLTACKGDAKQNCGGSNVIGVVRVLGALPTRHNPGLPSSIFSAQESEEPAGMDLRLCSSG